MAKREQQRTEYVVLEAVDEGGVPLWRLLDSALARRPEEAIKAVAQDGDHYRGGHYKAVAARSWDNDLLIETRQETVSRFAKPERVQEVQGNGQPEAARTEAPY